MWRAVNKTDINEDLSNLNCLLGTRSASEMISKKQAEVSVYGTHFSDVVEGEDEEENNLEFQ